MYTGQTVGYFLMYTNNDTVIKKKLAASGSFSTQYEIRNLKKLLQ